MLVFLETERLLLRQFDRRDVDLLIELDGDPRVMRYITGGTPTSREEVEGEVLPAFLGYYRRFPGYGFWADWPVSIPGDEHGDVEYAISRSEWAQNRTGASAG